MFLLKDFKIFKEFLKIYWIKFMEYKLNFVLQMFWTSVGTVVMYFIWKYIIAFGVFKIYSLNEITLYYFFILIFNTGIQWGRNIRYDIIYGDIVLTITKPFTLAKYFIFNLFSMTITNIIGYILTIFIGIYLIGFKSLFAILAVFLGMGINFLIISIIITLAFWTGKTRGIFLLKRPISLESSKYPSLNSLSAFLTKETANASSPLPLAKNRAAR